MFLLHGTVRLPNDSHISFTFHSEKTDGKAYELLQGATHLRSWYSQLPPSDAVLDENEMTPFMAHLYGRTSLTAEAYDAKDPSHPMFVYLFNIQPGKAPASDILEMADGIKDITDESAIDVHAFVMAREYVRSQQRPYRGPFYLAVQGTDAKCFIRLRVDEKTSCSVCSKAIDLTSKELKRCDGCHVCICCSDQCLKRHSNESKETCVEDAAFLEHYVIGNLHGGYNTCLFCNKQPAPVRCRRCGIGLYCSDDHSIANIEAHDAVCHGITAKAGAPMIAIPLDS